METAYKLIKDNYLVIFKLAKAGLIRKSLILNLKIYEDYLDMHPIPKMQVYKELGKKHNLSSYAIKKIINKLNKKA